MRVIGAVIVFSMLFMSRAAAIEPCPENPCAGDLEHCFTTVDWVLDGTIISVNNGLTKQCLHLLGEDLCRGGWDGGKIEFRVVSALKGVMPEGTSQLTLSAASVCWEDTARVSENLSGKQVRLFGINPGHGIGHGIVRAVALSDVVVR